MTNKEILAEHNARLSAIKAKIEQGGSGGGSGEEYSLRTLFYYESWNTFFTLGGYYTVDGEATTYFESGTDLLITGLNKDSTLDIYLPVEQYVAEEDGDQFYLWEVEEIKVLGCDVAIDDSAADTYEGLFRITLSKFTGDVTALFYVDFE